MVISVLTLILNYMIQRYEHYLVDVPFQIIGIVFSNIIFQELLFSFWMFCAILNDHLRKWMFVNACKPIDRIASIVVKWAYVLHRYYIIFRTYEYPRLAIIHRRRYLRLKILWLGNQSGYRTRWILCIFLQRFEQASIWLRHSYSNKSIEN